MQPCDSNWALVQSLFKRSRFTRWDNAVFSMNLNINLHIHSDTGRPWIGTLEMSGVQSGDQIPFLLSTFRGIPVTFFFFFLFWWCCYRGRDLNAFIKSHVPGWFGRVRPGKACLEGGRRLGLVGNALFFCVEAVHILCFDHSCKKRKGFTKSKQASQLFGLRGAWR